MLPLNSAFRAKSPVRAALPFILHGPDCTFRSPVDLHAGVALDRRMRDIECGILAGFRVLVTGNPDGDRFAPAASHLEGQRITGLERNVDALAGLAPKM